MRLLLLIGVFTSVAAQGQLPRNTQDKYEYTQEIHLNVPDTAITARAKSFFLQPFIVHWDSVAFVDAVHTGKGHINVRLHHKLASFVVPVALKLEVSVKDNAYRYSVRHLEADKKNSKYQFPLEDKPATVNAVAYEQLLQKTHRYIGSVISLLKRYMQGDF